MTTNREGAGARVEAPTSGTLTPATVTRVDGARVGVESEAFGAISARVGLPHYRPRVGDAVLVAASADGGRYVIGVLRALREVPDPIVADDGSSAAIERDEGGEVLRVRDGSGRLLFEHRPGRSVVHAPEGDLAFAAEGLLSLTGGQGVRIDGGPELHVTSRRTRLDTDRLGAEVGEARVRARDASLVVGTLRTVAERVAERAETVERTAGRVIEKAREAYREVEGLSQTRAGRLRLVAERAFTVLSEQATLKAKDDVKIKGEKIYLA